MKAIMFSFLLVAGMAQAEILDVKCMKNAKSLGFTMVDSYQLCKGHPSVKGCALLKQAENKKVASDKKELKALAKKTIQECNK